MVKDLNFYAAAYFSCLYLISVNVIMDWNSETAQNVKEISMNKKVSPEYSADSGKRN